MLLFKPEHVQPILDGRKTQTRRLWPHGQRVKVGAIHQCRTRMLDAESCFARIAIKQVQHEPLGWITNLDAWAEGYDDAAAYMEAFERINGAADPDQMVYVVSFDLVTDAALIGMSVSSQGDQ